jgi:hypothetical protein
MIYEQNCLRICFSFIGSLRVTSITIAHTVISFIRSVYRRHSSNRSSYSSFFRNVSWSSALASSYKYFLLNRALYNVMANSSVLSSLSLYAKESLYHMARIVISKSGPYFYSNTSTEKSAYLSASRYLP